jgi:ligand-binding sensor domain-containing protein
MKNLILLVASLAFASMVFAQHTLIMKSGEKMDGLVTSLNNGVIELHKNQTVSKINLSEVSQIIFDKPVQTATSEIGEKITDCRFLYDPLQSCRPHHKQTTAH